MSNIFVYGSLLADEVVEQLLQRVPKTQPASIQGFRRHKIQKRIYPAVIKSIPSESVKGRVFLDLTPEEVEILDEMLVDFEDEDYNRQDVIAELENGTTVKAAVYIWQDALRSILYGSWSYAEFREQHLANFLDMMREWEKSGDFPEDVA